MFKIVIRLFGSYHHGVKAGQVNPKEQATLTLYREGIAEKKGLSAPMKDIKKYLEAEFGSTVYKFETIELVSGT